MKLTSVLSAIAISISLVGCASYTPPTASDPHAKIQGSRQTKGFRVVILEVNGSPLVSSAKKYTGMCYEPEPDDVHLVAPGNCTIKAQAYNEAGSYGLLTGWSTKGTVSFIAKQGKKYSVRAKVDDNLVAPDQAEFYVVEIQ